MKISFDEQEEEALYIDKESLCIIKLLGAGNIQQAQQDAQTLLKIVANRERTDRCYYCHSHKKELGTEKGTDLTQCIDCAGIAYGVRLEQRRQLKDHLNYYG